MEIRPVGGVIGAEVSGIDLQQPLSDDQVAQIEKGLIDHLVLFFRGQNLTDQGQRDFAARFGPLEAFPLAPAANPDVPEMHTLSFETGAAALGSHVDSWHADGTYMRCPPMGTVLRAVELPSYGGDTCWANMYAAARVIPSDRVRRRSESIRPPSVIAGTTGPGVQPGDAIAPNVTGARPRTQLRRNLGNAG